MSCYGMVWYGMVWSVMVWTMFFPMVSMVSIRFPVLFPWWSNGFPMFFAWLSNGFRWCSYVILMVFQWFSYVFSDFTMVFYGYIMLCYVILCDGMVCYVMPCHVMSCHVHGYSMVPQWFFHRFFFSENHSQWVILCFPMVLQVVFLMFSYVF